MTLAEAEAISPRRKWTAIGVATLLMLVSYWSILFAVTLGNSEGEAAQNATGPLALGFALIPFVFLALAFLSGHKRAPGAVLKAMGLMLLIALPLGLANMVFGLVAGFGAGGVVALRAEEYHSLRTRALAVAIAVVYTLLMLFIIPEAALLTGGFVSLLAVGIADSFSERHVDAAT